MSFSVNLLTFPLMTASPNAHDGLSRRIELAGQLCNRQIIHRGKYKSLTAQQRRWLKRRQAVEPAIGHLKSDHRMNRCWLQGQSGDALHAVLCATGYNLR